MTNLDDLFLYDDGVLLVDTLALDMSKAELQSFLVALSFYKRWPGYNKIIFHQVKLAADTAATTRDLNKYLEPYQSSELISTPKYAIYGFVDLDRFYLLVCTKRIIGYAVNVVEVVGHSECTVEGSLVDTVGNIIASTITVLCKNL